jgi:uncharacterized membrane protein YjgN (DUF898 family)
MQQSSHLRISFTARGGELFVLLIKNLFLTLITLGVYSFWARVHVQRYFYEHTNLAGGRFGWHATGKERFIGFLKASVIMAAIFAANALLVKISPYLGMILPLAFIMLLPAIIVARYRYRMARTSFNQIRFRFTGRAGELAVIVFKGALLTIVTFGFYAPWLAVDVRRYLYENTRIGSSNLQYEGSGGEILVMYLVAIVLTILTFGIYRFWFTAKLANYHTNHTRFQGAPLSGDVDGGNVFITNLAGQILSFLTLGIYLPWYMVRLQKVMLEGVSLTAEPDYTQMQAQVDTGASALAEGIADAASLLDNIADFLS